MAKWKRWISTVTVGKPEPFRYVITRERQWNISDGKTSREVGKPWISRTVYYRHKLRGKKIRRKRWW